MTNLISIAKLGVRFILESPITMSSREGAEIVFFMDGNSQFIEADSLLFATPNIAEDYLTLELQDSGLDVINIGNRAVPRQAPFIIYEEHRTGLKI